MSSFQELGFATYADYLKGDHWQSLRTRLLADAKCFVCSETSGLHLHHKTYERVGSERDTDLMVLCGDCHKRLHDHLSHLLPNASLSEQVQQTDEVMLSCFLPQGFEFNDFDRLLIAEFDKHLARLRETFLSTVRQLAFDRNIARHAAKNRVSKAEEKPPETPVDPTIPPKKEWYE